MPIPLPKYKYKLILLFWKLAKVQRWLLRLPVFRAYKKAALAVSEKDNDAVIIPVQETVSGGENTVLPYQVLAPLIKAADGHFTLNQCPCRQAEGCRTYPIDFGCLYLGPAVDQIPGGVGRKLTKEESLQHLKKGIQHGLVPMIVHASFDASMLSIPYESMLAVCFCCDCCCTVRHHLRMGPSTLDDTVHRLPGLTVVVKDGCVGCGVCEQVCPVGTIILSGRRALIDQARCKGCGLCVEACPQQAITMQMDDTNRAVANLFARIRMRTNIGI